MKARLIVYDLDGTLADTRKDIAGSANTMRFRMGMGPLAEEQICRYVGLGLNRLVESCLETREPARVEQGTRIYRAHYAEHLLDHSRLYPGVAELLEHFRGRKQAVITNKPNPYSRQIVEALGLAGYFTEVIAGDDGYPKKPDPASLRAMMGRAAAGPGGAVFVGDSPIEVETGAKAGAITVGVAQGFCDRSELEQAKPAHLVEGFPQLLALARERSW